MINSDKCRRQARLIAAGLFFPLTMFCYTTLLWSQSRVPTVLVSKVEQAALIEEVPLSGTVISPRIAKLSTEVSGIVETLKVDIGDQVQAGDEILQLNSELEALSLSAARAATEQAHQKLQDTKRRMADAQVLAKRQTVSVNELKSLAAQVRIDSAGLARFRAEQERRAAQLSRHNLSAPFTGVISRKLVEQGEWVQPGQPVVELIATTGLRIDFQVPQSVYIKLDQVAGVHVKLGAMPGKTFDGRIESVIPVTDPNTRTFLVRVALNDPEVRIAPGMSASALLKLSSGIRGVVVHRDALLRYPDGRIAVWVVNQKDGQTMVSEQLVQTGRSFNGKVAITHGLSPDTLVVVQGNEALRDGQLVNVQQPNKAGQR